MDSLMPGRCRSESKRPVYQRAGLVGSAVSKFDDTGCLAGYTKDVVAGYTKSVETHRSAGIQRSLVGSASIRYERYVPRSG